jgi:hypothetical protein
MEHDRRRLLSEAMRRVSQRVQPGRYHPEKHYMRGPGPKTLTKIGEMYRSETNDIAGEPLPQRWLELVDLLNFSKKAD